MRSIESAVQSALDSLTPPRVVALLYVADLSLRLTSHPVEHTWEGDTYTPASFVVRELSENLNAAVPTSSITIDSLDGSEQARFWSDSWRGKRVSVTVIRDDGLNGTGEEVWPTQTWRVARDGIDDRSLSLRSELSDATKTRIPSVTSKEYSCEHVYGPDARELGIESLCPYRGPLTSCSRRFRGANGCQAHFPDLDANGDPWTATSTGDRFVQAKPFGGMRSGITDRLEV